MIRIKSKKDPRRLVVKQTPNYSDNLPVPFVILFC